jgi:hypothetical protein
VASEIVRVTDDAQMRFSMLKSFVELAHCCRDAQNLHGMYAVDLNQWPCSGSRVSWRSCRPSGRGSTPELDQLCNAKSRCAAALRARVGVAGI